MTPHTTPTMIPTGGDFLEPRFDVESDELPDGTLEEMVEVALARAEVAEGDIAF